MPEARTAPVGIKRTYLLPLKLSPVSAGSLISGRSLCADLIGPSFRSCC